MLTEFEKVARRGNVIDMAVGVIVGGAFGTIVKSLVDDIIMPPIGLVLGGIDFSSFFAVLRQGTPPAPYSALAEAKRAGAVTMNYGVFVNGVISFLIVTCAVFMLVRSANAIRHMDRSDEAVPATKACTFCTSVIPIKPTRCPLRTSQLSA